MNKRFSILMELITGMIFLLTISCKKNPEPDDKITDTDGNVYTSVTIGTQVWLVENLKTTKYQNGEQIHLIVFHDHQIY